MFITQTSASGSTTSAHLDALRKFKKVKAKVSSVEKVHQYGIQNIVYCTIYTCIICLFALIYTLMIILRVIDLYILCDVG